MAKYYKGPGERRIRIHGEYVSPALINALNEWVEQRSRYTDMVGDSAYEWQILAENIAVDLEKEDLDAFIKELKRRKAGLDYYDISHSRELHDFGVGSLDKSELHKLKRKFPKSKSVDYSWVGEFKEVIKNPNDNDDTTEGKWKEK